MPDLDRARHLVSADALGAAALKELLDPFHSAAAFPREALPALARRDVPTALLVIRVATHLQPAGAPPWPDALVLARAVAAPADSDWTLHAAPTVRTAPDSRDAWWWAWSTRLPGHRGGPPTPVERRWDNMVDACAAFMVAPQGEVGARARAYIQDAMDAPTPPSAWDAVLAMEAALLGGGGPRDKLVRRAREVLAGRQDPATGGWLVPGQVVGTAWNTFMALMLLMRGG